MRRPLSTQHNNYAKTSHANSILRFRNEFASCRSKFLRIGRDFSLSHFITSRMFFCICLSVCLGIPFPTSNLDLTRRLSMTHLCRESFSQLHKYIIVSPMHVLTTREEFNQRHSTAAKQDQPATQPDRIVLD